MRRSDFEGILPKRPYLPCVSMAGRALFAGYHRFIYASLNFIALSWSPVCRPFAPVLPYYNWESLQQTSINFEFMNLHDDVIKWKHLPRHWPFVLGIVRSPINSPHKGQWRGALKFSFICARINGWVNNREAGDLRRHRAHYDVIVMKKNAFGYTCTMIACMSVDINGDLGKCERQANVQKTSLSLLMWSNRSKDQCRDENADPYTDT